MSNNVKLVQEYSAYSIYTTFIIKQPQNHQKTQFKVNTQVNQQKVTNTYPLSVNKHRHIINIQANQAILCSPVFVHTTGDLSSIGCQGDGRVDMDPTM